MANWYDKLFPNLTPQAGQSILDKNNAAAQSWGNYIGAQGGGGGGGGNPYAGILNEFLQGAKSRFAGQSAQDAASRDAAIRRLFVSYGQVPDFAKLGISDQTKGFLGKALNSKTLDLARQNTEEGTSVYARQAKANEIANRRIPATLASRGILHSGQTGYDLGQQAQAFKNQSFDTLNELLGGVEGTIGSFLQAERARADALAAAEMQARLAAMQGFGGYMYGDGGGGGQYPQPRAGAAPTRASNPAGSYYRGIRNVGGSAYRPIASPGFRPF